MPTEAIARRRGLRATAPARTIVDLAAHLSPARLEPLVAHALRTKLTTADDLLRLASGRRGARRLQAVLDTGPAFTRSQAERKLLTLLRDAGLPAPQTNARIANLEVDFLWPGHGLVVEVDGFAYHAGRDAFERDRNRDLRLHAAGLAVLRVTWRQLTKEPELLVARLAAALAPRSPQPAL